MLIRDPLPELKLGATEAEVECRYLVKDTANGPNVNLFRVGPARDHLWAHKIKRSQLYILKLTHKTPIRDPCIRYPDLHIPPSNVLLAAIDTDIISTIRPFPLPPPPPRISLRKQYILRFQVPVHVVLAVDVVEAVKDLDE